MCAENRHPAGGASRCCTGGAGRAGRAPETLLFEEGELERAQLLSVLLDLRALPRRHRPRLRQHCAQLLGRGLRRGRLLVRGDKALAQRRHLRLEHHVVLPQRVQRGYHLPPRCAVSCVRAQRYGQRPVLLAESPDRLTCLRATAGATAGATAPAPHPGWSRPPAPRRALAPPANPCQTARRPRLRSRVRDRR